MPSFGRFLLHDLQHCSSLISSDETIDDGMVPCGRLHYRVRTVRRCKAQAREIASSQANCHRCRPASTWSCKADYVPVQIQHRAGFTRNLPLQHPTLTGGLPIVDTHSPPAGRCPIRVHIRPCPAATTTSLVVRERASRRMWNSAEEKHTVPLDLEARSTCCT